MLNIQTIQNQTKREILNSCDIIPSEVSTQDASFVAIEDILRYLDDTPLFSIERDAVFANIIRISQLSPQTKAHKLAFYAFIPGILHIVKRVLRVGLDDGEEVFADVLAISNEKIANYQTDTRSQHVFASIVKDVCCAIYRGRKYENKVLEATQELAIEKSLFPDTHHSLDRESTRNSDEEDLTNYASQILAHFVFQQKISEQEAELVLQLRVLQRPSSHICRQFGIDRRTVVRRVERVLRRIGPELKATLLEAMPAS